MTLKELRENATLSVTELAARVGVHKSTVSYWESGRFEPRPAHIRKLAAVLNVSIPEVKAAIKAIESEGQGS